VFPWLLCFGVGGVNTFQGAQGGVIVQIWNLHPLLLMGSTIWNTQDKFGIPNFSKFAFGGMLRGFVLFPLHVFLQVSKAPPRVGWIGLNHANKTQQVNP
jgi:hypothetical protein